MYVYNDVDNGMEVGVYLDYDSLPSELHDPHSTVNAFARKLKTAVGSALEVLELTCVIEMNLSSSSSSSSSSICNRSANHDSRCRWNTVLGLT
jgi:hypothetical protein